MILSFFWNNVLASCSCTEVWVNVELLLAFSCYFVEKAIDFSFFLMKTGKKPPQKQLYHPGSPYHELDCYCATWSLNTNQHQSFSQQDILLIPQRGEWVLLRGKQGRCSGAGSQSVVCRYKCLPVLAVPFGCLRGGWCKHLWQRCSSVTWSEEVINLDLGWAVSDCTVPLFVPCSCSHMSVVWLKLLACAMGNISLFCLFMWKKNVIHSCWSPHLGSTAWNNPELHRQCCLWVPLLMVGSAFAPPGTVPPPHLSISLPAKRGQDT